MKRKSKDPSAPKRKKQKKNIEEIINEHFNTIVNNISDVNINDITGFEKIVLTKSCQNLNEFEENAKEKFDKLEQIIQDLEIKIQEKEQELSNITINGSTRRKRQEIRLEIEDLKSKIKNLKFNNDKEWFYKILEDAKNMDEYTFEREKILDEIQIGGQQCHLESMIKYKKTRIKKKKAEVMLYKNANINSGRMIGMRTIDLQDSKNETIIIKRVSRIIGEEFTVNPTTNTCPKCKSVMIYTAKPPSYCCSHCGYIIQHIDIRSHIHDDTNYGIIRIHKQDNKYVPENYHNQSMRKSQGKAAFSLPQEKEDMIYYELYRRKIFWVGDVIVNIVTDILESLSKDHDRNFSDLYSHVWGIVNKIRGARIFNMNTSDLEEYKSIFTKIEYDWNIIKQQNIPEWKDRSSFLSKNIVTIMCLTLLNYPPIIISMYKPLKGDKGMDIYQDIVNRFCELNNWKPFSLTQYTQSIKEVNLNKKGNTIMKKITLD